MKILKYFVTVTLIPLGLLHCSKGNNSSLSKSQLIEKQQQAEKAPAVAKSIEVPDLYSISKSNIQTRSVLTLRIADTHVDDITELSLLNDTTDATLVDHQPISMGLSQDTTSISSFSMTRQAADVIVKIYPGLADLRSKMKYGNNSLRLIAVAGDEERYNVKSVRFADFKYLGPAFMNRGDENEIEKPLSSGGLTPFAQGVSAASGGGSFLFTNPAHILTH